MPCTKLRKSLLDEIKEIFSKYCNHKDTINLKEKWTSIKTREDKLVETIEMIFEKNLQTKNKFNLQ